VAVCVDRPILSLDRPFTYELGPELNAGLGSLVQVPFHGKAVRGWVLGPTGDVPARTLLVKRRVSGVRFFDERMLALARWVSERYVVPLAAVLNRLTPPRVASEEPDVSVGVAEVRSVGSGGVGRAEDLGSAPPAIFADRYRNGSALLTAIGERRPAGFVLRPAPEDEVTLAVEAVGACLASGRRAIVLVPEARPVPATASAVLAAFGERAVAFVGGDRRTRYRTWLEVADGRGDVIVGTRPAVYAPVRNLGLLFVSRESNPAHREDRAPYSHVRDVALARAGMEDAVTVLASICPSSEAASLGLTEVAPGTRRWPPVEVVKPGPEGRAPRLVQALRTAHRGFVFAPLPGYGVAQRCKTCGAAATCAACGGSLRVEEGHLRCVVCEAQGRCAACGGTSFGIRRGGAERVEEWVAGVARSRVRRATHPRLPRPGEVLVGGPDVVRDLGPGGLDLVGIVDADVAERRPGLTARERALTVWMEAVAWARPEGRAIVQASEAGDPAVQALVRGNPERFHEDERRRRWEAGFPVGVPVFRVAGPVGVEVALQAQEPTTMLVSSVGEQTVCLLALAAGRVPAFGRAMRDLAARGEVARVEAEPHL
jgi:primosomal protein N' (replication factor Y)